MRILHVNKFLYRRGGAESYVDDLAGLQAAAGDEVEFFAMAHPENRPSLYSSSFPPYLELNPPPSGLADRLGAAGRMLWSRSARRGFAEVLDDFRPDVVHMHNIYSHLSPSILAASKERRVPAVMTLHDYKLACPTYQLMAGGTICEACIGGHFHNAVLKRCNRGSVTASALSALETAVHSRFRSYAPVDRFICPSQFMADKMRQAGVFPERLRHVPHFVETHGTVAPKGTDGPVVFAGRLSTEKGVDVLIDAVAAEASLHLVIAGDGPDREALERRARIAAPDRIQFTGRLEREETLAAISAATVVAVPSLWYENQPMVVLEAFACGTPVVSTDLGGLPEMVRSGVSGETVPAGNAPALGRVLAALVADPDRATTLGANARRLVAEDFSPERHHDRVRAVYDEARSTDPQAIAS